MFAETDHEVLTDIERGVFVKIDQRSSSLHIGKGSTVLGGNRSNGTDGRTAAHSLLCRQLEKIFSIFSPGLDECLGILRKSFVEH